MASSSQTAYNIWYGGWTYYVYATGDAWGYSFNTLSDSSLKENVNTISNALNKVLKLRGVTFTYKSSDSAQSPSQTHMGLIAQEVEQVVPEVVHTGKNELKGVQYQNLVGLLIEAIKQEDAKVTELQNRLDSCCNLSPQFINQPGGVGTNGTASNQATLYQNVPNPFNQTTAINYYIPANSTSASIMIFNMEGTLLQTNTLQSFGNGTLAINAGTLSAGMYLYSLIVNNQEVDTKKMILTK